MSEFKGTKGEWIADKGTTYTGVPDKAFEIGTDNQIIATIHGSHYDHTAVNKTEAEANAKLIAAAPELLESLQDLVYRVSQQLEHGEIRINKYHVDRSLYLSKKAIEKALK